MRWEVGAEKLDTPKERFGQNENYHIKMFNFEISDIAAAKVVRAIKFNRLFVRTPLLIKIVPFAIVLLPARVYDLVMGKWMGLYRSLSTITGEREDGKEGKI